MKRALIVLFAYVVVCAGLAAPEAFAHKISIHVRTEGDAVFVDCRYADGKKVGQGEIRVVDAGGVEVSRGRTDDNGLYSFKVVRRDQYRILLDDGTGHRAESRIEAGPPDVGGLPAPPPARPETDVEAVLESTLDRKLAPIHARLNELEGRGPDIRDILGGLGYILGIVGLAAYFRSRRGSR